jgi:hypothetical protein
MYVDSPDASAGKPFYGYSIGGAERVFHFYDAGSNTWRLSIDYLDVMEVDADGNLTMPGNKSFVQSVDTDGGEKEVVYTASEAATPHTEVAGVAELEDGRAAVELPDHFGWVTDAEEPIVVQITPYGGTSGTRVVERSTDRIVVEDLDGEGDYEFAYTVKGTREGQADRQVVRDPADGGPADAGSGSADAGDGGSVSGESTGVPSSRPVDPA